MTERSVAPPDTGHIVVDGHPIAFKPDDSVAIAILRAGETPAQGGTLCLAGDCGNCLVEADGIAYVRSCQVRARPGLTVRRHPRDVMPPLPAMSDPDVTLAPAARDGAGR